MAHPENAKRLPKVYTMMLNDGTSFMVMIEWQEGNKKFPEPTLWFRILSTRGKQLASLPLRDVAQVNELAIAIEGIAAQIESDKTSLPRPAKAL